MAITDPDPADASADDARPEGDGTVPPITSYGWPTWLRRTIIAVLLVGCAGLLVWANGFSDAGTTPKDQDPVIVSQAPPPGGTALRQTTIGAELQSGYDGRLTINGIAVPESQMEGARDPATVDPDDLKKNGLRPNNHNRVYFTPGPGKVIEKLPAGQVFVSIRYFKDRLPGGAGRAISWTFTVA